MYLWNYHALARQLKHSLPNKEKIKYLLAIMLYVPTGIMGSNWIPGFYRLIYRTANEMLLIQASSSVPPLKIFYEYNYITDIATSIIIGIGILACFIANSRGDGRNFIERFICLSVPITIRISFYVLIIFLATLLGSLYYFNYKLQLISNFGVLKFLKKLRHVKELSTLMAYISHRMHVFSCILSVGALVTIFSMLYKEIKTIAQQP